MIPSLLDRLAADGWSVIDLLGPAEVAQVGERIERLGLPEDHGFYASPAMAWGSVATSVSDEIRSIVEPAVARHLPHVRTFLAGVTSKGAGSPTPIPYHQDWTYCDERRWRATFFWCPLVDVDEGSGCLRVVPGSHRWSEGIRPSREREASQDLQEELERASIPVPLAAGQAIAFDPAVFHGSGPNGLRRRRPAFTVACLDVEAPLLHFHEPPDGPLEGYRVDVRFFTENPYRSRPVGYERIDPYGPTLQEDELRAALDRLAPTGGLAGSLVSTTPEEE